MNKDENDFNLAQMSDEELFVAYRAGNANAMDTLMERIGKPLFRTIYSRVGNRSVAEDIYQDTFERVVRNKEKFNPNQSLRSWVWSIALNRCVDHFRVKNRETPTDRADLGEDVGANPEQEASNSEKISLISKAIDELTEEQREVFFLREEAELSFAQISEQTGRALGTVLTQMRAALLKLRRVWEA